MTNSKYATAHSITRRSFFSCTKSLQIFTGIKMKTEHARVLRDFADFENTFGNKNHAQKMIDEAKEIFSSLEIPFEVKRTSLKK